MDIAVSTNNAVAHPHDHDGSESSATSVQAVNGNKNGHPRSTAAHEPSSPTQARSATLLDGTDASSMRRRAQEARERCRTTGIGRGCKPSAASGKQMSVKAARILASLRWNKKQKLLSSETKQLQLSKDGQATAPSSNPASSDKSSLRGEERKTREEEESLSDDWLPSWMKEEPLWTNWADLPSPDVSPTHHCHQAVNGNEDGKLKKKKKKRRAPRKHRSTGTN
eukprot:scpid92398/ scgid10756/ 